MRDYIEVAFARGMSEFGVSDHGPAYFLHGDHALPGTQMALSELANYVAEAKALQAEYAGRIRVLVGLEADYIEGREEELRTLLEAHEFDYVLGSVHYANRASIFKKARWETDDPEVTYTDYYRQVQLAARSGLFDILSHLTAVEAYGPPIAEELAAKLYPRVADAVAEGGCLVEINTSGYRKMGGDEPFPNRRMLRELIARGVPITYGADCHRPDEVGFASDRVFSLLQELGVNTDRAQLFRTRRGQTLQAYASR